MRVAPKTVTIRDVAREARVSIASASRALNNSANVTEGVRERVLRAARSLRYVPHSGARSLSTRKTDTIGVVLPDLYGEFFSEIIRGVDEAARARGLHLLVSNSHGDSDEAALAIRSMRGRVDGLLVMSPHVDASVLAENIPGDLPLVLMNTRVEGGAHPAFLIDNYAGAHIVTRHLAKAGRQRVAHISGAIGNFEAEERRRGYLDAIGNAKPIFYEGDFSEESGYRAGQAMAAAATRPDAVFAANDMMAVGCLTALEEAGLRVPDDIALAGFDDVPIARLLKPSLTTARIRIADLGRRALERLAGLIAAPAAAEHSPEIAQPELVVRDSSRSTQTAGEGRLKT